MHRYSIRNFPVFALFLSLLVLGSSGCKLFRNLGKNKNSEAVGLALAEELRNNALNFETLLINGKATIQLPEGAEEESGFSGNVNVSYRLQIAKDSLILLRVSKIIELAKILIRPDSIFVQDKLNQNFYACDYSMVKKYTGLESSFSVLQALLLGDYQPIPEDMSIKGEATANPLIFTGLYKDTELDYFLDRELRKLVRINAVRQAQNQATYITYDNFEAFGKQKIPMQVNIEVPEPTTNFRMTHRKISPNATNASFRFSIPEDFVRQDCPE